MKDKHFEELRESIHKELMWANQNFEIFNQLFQEMERYFSLPYKYKSFFGASMKAHYDAFVISVYNVTKKDKQTGNIVKLFNYIDSAKLIQYFDSNEIKQMKEKLDSVMDTIGKLHIAREQYIGHNQLIKRHSSTVHTIDDCIKLLNVLNDILINLSLKYDGKIIVMPTNYDYAISDIFQDLIQASKK